MSMLALLTTETSSNENIGCGLELEFSPAQRDKKQNKF